MKKIFYFSLGAAMMLCLTNCAKTEEPGKPDVVPGPEEQVLDFSLYAATPTLKTVNDGLDTKWASGDAINLFHDAAGQKTYINDGKFSLSSEDVVNGLFKGKLSQALAGGAAMIGMRSIHTILRTRLRPEHQLRMRLRSKSETFR